MKCGEPSAPGDAGVDRFVHRLQIFDRSGKGYDWRAAARFLFTINALAAIRGGSRRRRTHLALARSISPAPTVVVRSPQTTVIVVADICGDWRRRAWVIETISGTRRLKGAC